MYCSGFRRRFTRIFLDRIDGTYKSEILSTKSETNSKIKMPKTCVFVVFCVKNTVFGWKSVANLVRNDAKLRPNGAKLVPNDTTFFLFERIHTNEHKLTTTEYTERH